MGRIVADATVSGSGYAQVSIKHTRTQADIDGNDRTILDYQESISAHEAKTNYTAMVTQASASHAELVTALASITTISGSNDA